MLARCSHIKDIDHYSASPDQCNPCYFTGCPKENHKSKNSFSQTLPAASPLRTYKTAVSPTLKKKSKLPQRGPWLANWTRLSHSTHHRTVKLTSSCWASPAELQAGSLDFLVVLIHLSCLHTDPLARAVGAPASYQPPKVVGAGALPIVVRRFG